MDIQVRQADFLYHFYLFSLLQCSVIQQDLDISDYNGQIELHLVADTRKYNMLLLASESGNAKLAEALLKYGIDSQVKLQEGEVTAQGLAWKGRHFDVLLTLLQANLPFPPEIDINGCSEELKRFIETCQEVHKMIEEENKEKLDDIIKQNPNLRYFYTLSNKSALKAALDLKLINIYELLISKNLLLAPHEDTDKIWEQFERSEKIKLRNINFKYSKDIPEKHINILMFNTSLSHDEEDEEGKRKLILRAYKTLNTDLRLKIILKIVAATKVFKIIFDFHRDSTYRIDPTTGPWTQGIFYFSGRIVVGAKQLLDPDTESHTLGVLIHELCHYAMVAVYHNKARPYTIKDQQAKEEFDRIIKKCQENAEVEKIIGLVYECYTEAQYPAELIVRPPHLIAFYSKEPDMLQDVIKTFNELFDYYLNVVILAMEQALQEIEGRLVYKPTHTYVQLSDQDKDKVKNAVVKYKNVEIKFAELFPGNSDILEHLTSDHISFMLDNKVLNFDDPQFRYLEEQIDFKWENLAGNLREKFLDSDLNFQGKIVQFKELNDLYPEAFNALTSQQIINVLSGSEIKIGKEFVSENKFYVERKFILENAKLISYEYENGHEYVYNYETRDEHVENRTKDKSFQEFSDELLKKDFNEISQLFDKVQENSLFKRLYYDLNTEDFRFMHKNSNEIIEQAEKEKILILSSEAGAGKTVTFEKLAMEIKSKFPTRWVSYLDLPKYTKFYNVNGTAENLLNDILELSIEKNNFEVRIFEESFKSGNLVLIWNAFDEISPTFYDFILNKLKDIHEISSNVQFVCTRPLYSDQLSKAFKVRTWQLVPFDDEKKKEFLREFFISENVASDKIQENVEKVEKIVENIEYEDSFVYNFETPLMLKLIAEIHENKNLFESANIFGIFEAFVENKIEIWLKKSENSFSIAKKLLFSGSLKIILQKFALLNELNIFSFTTLALKLRKLQIMQKEIPKDFPIEEISKMGILFINGKNNFQFSHKTISEFFVAQYFIENIFNIDGAVDRDEAELRLELFYELTQSYNEAPQITTDFMTSFLQMRPQVPKKFNPTISKLLRTKFKNFFIRMLDTNYPKVFEFLFEFFKPDHDLLVDLLHVHEPETFYTAIFNPNHFALFTNSEKIKSLAHNCLTDAEFQKFLTGKNQKGKILFGIHFYGLLGVTKSNDAYSTEIKELSGTSFWDFFPKIKDCLTVGEQKELFVAAFSPKIYLFYDKMFSPAAFSAYEKLWTNSENLLTQNEMQDALGDALVFYFEIIPSLFANHEEFLNLLLEKVVKFLSNSQIFKMFLTKNILHEAHWDDPSFKILWNFLSKYTNEQERRVILLQDDLDDKNFYFWSSYNEVKENYSKYEYRYFYYDFTPFKIFHRALTIPTAFTFDFTKQIYQKHFSKPEIQEIILSSNDFLYYAIGRAFEEPFKKFVSFLEEFFEGNEKLLKEYFERKIEPINLSVFELVEDFRGLPHSKPKWFKNLKTISDLYEKIKNS